MSAVDGKRTTRRLGMGSARTVRAGHGPRGDLRTTAGGVTLRRMLVAPIDATPIRWRRIVCLFSQAELAAAVHSTPKTIRQIELGRSLPSVSLAIAIARALETTVEELFATDA